MMHDQAGVSVRFEWGEAAVRQLGPQADAVVIVDVLSFSTAVDVALGRGATVYPYRWKDGSAARFAEQHRALLASHDRLAGRYSLSPQSLSTLPAGARLVLPSPNGATLSALADEGGRRVYTACLRNAAAVGTAVGVRHARVLVVAAGERWPDGTLRPAVEDLWGAGAVIAALPGTRSPEAQAAADAFTGVRPHLAASLRACSSGRELTERGFPADVELAAAYGVSAVVPVLQDGAYSPAP